MKRLLALALVIPVALCLAGDKIKDKPIKKSDVQVYDNVTGDQVGTATFDVTPDSLTVDMHITDGPPLVHFDMRVTADPDIITLKPSACLRVTDEKGRAHETITYGIAFDPNKIESFEATLTAYTWTAGPVTLSPKVP